MSERPEGALKVLDKGFVRLVDFMGGDMAVVEAARVSHKSVAKDEEADRKLIAYLLNHNHGTPFEHVVFKFHVKLPIFVARQWIRHRMSSYNETSFRYREAPEEFYFPEKWRVQDTKNKQGSVGIDILDHNSFSQGLAEECAKAKHVYDEMLKVGIAREMARMVLPVNLYTEWYWTVNARALMHFITLRSDDHAQWETRQYSDSIAEFFRHKMPWTYEAFLSRLDHDRYRGLNIPTKEAV